MKTRKIALLFVAVAILILTLCSCALGGSSGGNKISSGKKVTFTKSMITRNPTEGTSIYVYTGQPITYPESDFTFEVNGNYPSPSDFTFKYENNIEAGENTAKLTITAKNSNPYCKGSVVLYFSIAAGSETATDKESLIALLGNKNLTTVQLDGNITIDEGETFSIPEGSNVRLSGKNVITNNGTFNVAGTLTVDGSTYYNGGSVTGSLVNDGTINLTGTLKVAGRGEFLNNGTVTSSGGKIINSGIIYTNDTSLPDLTNETVGNQYIRQALTPEDISLPYMKEGGEEFNQSLGYVRPTPVLEHNTYCNVTYTNNDRIGTATVTLTPEEKDFYYYGSASVNFVILPGVATVTTYAQLAETKNSGNYDRYEIGEDITVPEGETITFDANEKINFSKKEAKLNISGNFINNGTITAQKPYTNSYSGETTLNYYSLTITVNEGGSYSGTGKLSSEKISVVAYDNFTLAAPEEVSFVTFHQNKGTLTVSSGLALIPSPGKAVTLGMGSEASLVITETGSVDCPNLTASSSIANAGTLTISNQLYLYSGAQITNSGTINLGAETIIYDMKWTNEGTIVNNGDIVCDKVSSFTNDEDGFDNSNGYIWTYDAFPYVTENVTLKKKLSVDNVLLEYTETPYTSEQKIPTFTVAGEIVTRSDYVLYVMNNMNEIIYTTNTKHNKYNTTYPRDVGTYTLSIRMNNSKCPYGGFLDLPYTITKGTCHLTNPLTFSGAIKNTNYNKILLEKDISLGYTSESSIADYRLSSGITLDTNGYSIDFSYSNFYINGTLIISAPTEDREYSILMKKTSNLRNNHNIVNNGILCFDSSAESYFYDTTATFLNDGTVYAGMAFSDNLVTTESTGVIYHRQTILNSDFNLEYSETVYDGTTKVPTVNYTGNLITDEVFQTYAVTYSKNKNAGTAEITVKPGTLSEVYYGTARLFFVIKKASKIVTSLTNDDFSDSENYFEVKLANDVILSEDVFVPAEIAFNFSTYSVSCTTGRLLALNGAVLRAEADSRSTFMKNINNVHEMTLIGDITDKITVTFSYPEEHIKYAYYSSYNNNLYTSTLDIKTLTIDMNGYSMTGGFEITTNKKNYSHPYFTLNITNSRSMTNTSVIGDVADTEYGFTQNSIDMKKRIVVNLSDISVAGINLNGHNGGEGIQLNANNCVIETAGQYALNVPWRCINADTEFTDCTFSAAGNNGIICYIYSGKHTFTHCNVTSSSFNWRTDSGMFKPNIDIIK